MDLTFNFDADPDQDPDPHQSDANLRLLVNGPAVVPFFELRRFGSIAF
jgi:hypothetical protein